MSVPQWPFQRQVYGPGLDNPIYDEDISSADSAVLSAVFALLNNQTFSILAGLVYTESISGPNYYTPGYFAFNGILYYQPSAFNEGERLKPNVTGVMPYTFPQTSATQNLYNIYYSQATSSPTGATMVFSGNMNGYRYDLTSLFNAIQVLQTAASLAVSVVANLPASYTVFFGQDQSIFFTSATVNTAIHFNFTGAIPGTVVTMKWTFGTSLALSIPPASGQSILLESGDQSEVGENTNVLTILYAGINESGLPEVRIVLSQPTVPS